MRDEVTIYLLGDLVRFRKLLSNLVMAIESIQNLNLGILATCPLSNSHQDQEARINTGHLTNHLKAPSMNLYLCCSITLLLLFLELITVLTGLSNANCVIVMGALRLHIISDSL